MTILTQRNATLVGAVAFGWATVHNAGMLPDAPWTRYPGPVLVFLTAVMGFLGYRLTPNGSTLPPEIADLPKGAVVPTPAQDAIDQEKLCGPTSSQPGNSPKTGS